jgi:hypothetical protein
MFLAWGWSHAFDRLWFYLGVAVTAYFLWRAFQQWKEGIIFQPEDQPRGETRRADDPQRLTK